MPPTNRAQPHRPPALILALVALLPLVAACGRPGPGGTAFTRAGTTTPTPGGTPGTPGPKPTVSKAVNNVVTADGKLVPPVAPQALSFPSTGLLLEVNATEGQAVKAGDVLAKMETAAADVSVAQAETALAQAQAAVAKLERGDSVDSTRIEVERAKNQLWAEQAQRDSVCGAAQHKMATQASCDAAQANVQALEQGVELAQKNLAAAQASQPADLTSARAQLAEARLALDQAKQDRTHAVLSAPFDGVVTQVNVANGVRVAPGTPVLTLAKTTPLRFATTNLGERNIGDVHEGAPAKVTLTAYPDQPLKATVQRIAAQASNDDSGLTVVTVYLDVDPAGLPLRAGMTGRAEIEVGAQR
jgi:multidrug resistance efflux pump